MSLKLVDPPHVIQMEQTLIAAEFAPHVYRALVQWYHLDHWPPWDKVTNKAEAFREFADLLRDMQPMRCAYCSVEYRLPDSDYCSDRCAIDAQRG